MNIADMTKEDMGNFIEYCMSFYAKDGIYELNFTENEVLLATELYMIQLLNAGQEFCSDTLDRERVRDIVLKSREFLGKNA